MVRPGAMLSLGGTLLEKLRKIEALPAGTRVDGEREAARRAAGDPGAAGGTAERGARGRSAVLGAAPVEVEVEPGRRYSTVLLRAPGTCQANADPEGSAVRSLQRDNDRPADALGTFDFLPRGGLVEANGPRVIGLLSKLLKS